MSPGGTEEYMSFVKALRERYPNLINLERHLPKFTDRPCRVREICIPPLSGETGPEFTDPQELRDYLGKRQPNVPGQCRVYVLENLDNDFVAVFGQHFNIDPTFFATHVRTTVWEGSPFGNNTPKLLRLRDPDRSFILRYSELRLFDQDIKEKRLLDSKGRGKYQASLRYIITPSESDYLKNFWRVGLARRCISLWSEESSPDCSDVLILVDPQVKIDGLKNGSYQYGYVDFTPWSDVESLDPSIKPTRECAYDDVCHYLSNVTQDDSRKSLRVPTLVVKQLVLSHTVALIEYLKALISTIENKLREDNATDLSGYSWLEGALKDLFLWNRRLWEFCGDTEIALDGLRILPQTEINAIADYDRWTSCDEDFRYIHRKMTSLKDRMYELITSANGLIGLVQAQRSVKATEASVKAAEASVKATEATRDAAEASTQATNATLVATQESTNATKATLKAAEASEASEKASAEAAKSSLAEAKAVRALTVVGMLYLPLTFTSALFSMGQDYGPGQGKFWVYWAVALPAGILAFIVYSVVLKVTFRKPEKADNRCP